MIVKIVRKTDTIISQQFRESWGIQIINEWVERSRREWDEHVMKMNVEISAVLKYDRAIDLSEDDLQDFRKEDGAT